MKSDHNEIDILREISSVVLRERKAPLLMDRVLEILSRKMGMVHAALTLRHGDTFQIEVSYGLDESEKRRGSYHFGEGITGTVAQTGFPCLVPDIAENKNFLNRTGSHKEGEHLAFLCVPVVYGDETVGTLSIECKKLPDADLEERLKLLEIIGNLTAEAIALRKAECDEWDAISAENTRLRRAVERQENPGEIIGNSGSMQVVYQQIRQVAPTSATVLIRGESGTGKELIARAIRRLSPRADKPLVTLNCAAIPETLIESELFGHERGAFTGADAVRVGRVEEADGGTLFLDEVGDLSPASQIKLLRFLQERKFSRVGSNKERKTDVRVIAATSRNLEELIEREKFRLDLFYRLNVFPIYLPNLASRRADIILLAEHFLERCSVRHGKSVKKITAPAVNMLMAYHWPGNVRELENCIERAVLTASDDAIHGYNLPPSLQTSAGRGDDELFGEPPQGPKDYKDLVDRFERKLLVGALKETGGNMSAAARLLNLSPRMMHYNVKRLAIDPARPEG